MKPIPLVVMAKHPVFYTVPIYRALERDPRFDVEVLFWSDTSLRPVYFEEIKQVFQPQVDLLSGYRHRFLRNWGNSEKGDRFFSHFNPGLSLALARRRRAVVLVHGYDKASCWMALATAKMLGQRFVFRGEATPRDNSGRGLRARAKPLIVRTYLRAADVVLYSCSGNRSFLAEHVDSPGKLHPFPCSVDNDRHRAEHERLLPEREAIRRALGIGEHHIALILPARLTQRKRPMDLVRALERCRDLPFFALIVGNGPEREPVARALETAGLPHALPGHVDPSEIPRYFTAADAFVLLSDYDPSPKALNEALNYALPVLVSTAAGTATDLVAPGENGFLVEAGNLDEIEGALRCLAEADRAALGARSREIVSDWSVEADVEALYQALTAVGAT